MQCSEEDGSVAIVHHCPPLADCDAIDLGETGYDDEPLTLAPRSLTIILAKILFLVGWKL